MFGTQKFLSHFHILITGARQYFLKIYLLKLLPDLNCISVFVLDHAFEAFIIGICCFSAKHAALRRKNKDWLARSWNNVWSVLFQYKANIVKMQHVLAMIQLKNFSFGIKQQSLTIWSTTSFFKTDQKKKNYSFINGDIIHTFLYTLKGLYIFFSTK